MTPKTPVLQVGQELQPDIHKWMGLLAKGKLHYVEPQKKVAFLRISLAEEAERLLFEDEKIPFCDLVLFVRRNILFLLQHSEQDALESLFHDVMNRHSEGWQGEWPSGAA